MINLLDRNAIFASFNDGQGRTPEPLAIPVLPDEPVAITPVNNNLGFAGYNFKITGGAGGTVVTVDIGTALKSALAQAKSSGVPVTIYVNGVITDCEQAAVTILPSKLKIWIISPSSVYRSW